jgi:nucleoside-diphosphate-sugar epimerase
LDACSEIDVVIHTSALNSPTRAVPEDVFRSNVIGTYNIHEAAGRAGVQRVISTSSEAALGFFFGPPDARPDYLPIDENHPLRPQESYGLSKKVGESIAECLGAQWDMTTIVIRPSWIVQPEDYTRNTRIREGLSFPIDRFGLFAYIDVRDLADAYVRCLDAPIQGHETMFVCADDSTALVPLATLLPQIDPGVVARASRIQGLASGISNAKAKRLLGWKPQRSWREEIQK